MIIWGYRGGFYLFLRYFFNYLFYICILNLDVKVVNLLFYEVIEFFSLGLGKILGIM